MISLGRKNSITDISGIRVGHFTLSSGEIQTGVTVILPYPLNVRNRKLFIGSFSRGNWNEWTGLHVAQDFGTFSSPIVLCNSTTVGIAYDALISFGHERAQDLPIDNAWPPIVIGMDDGYLNNLRRREITHDQILRTVKAASDQPMACGSVGIGQGLCAFGGKGGVGDASRSITIEAESCTLGVFVAANGGKPIGAQDSSGSSVSPGFIVITETDAPFLPEQLRQLAESAAAGLDRVGRVDEDDRILSLAFSTSNTIDGAFEDEFKLFSEKWLGHEAIEEVMAAATDCCSEAIRRAMRQTEAVTGRKGRTVAPVDLK